MATLRWKETSRRRDPRTGKPREVETPRTATFATVEAARAAMESMLQNKACTEFSITE